MIYLCNSEQDNLAVYLDVHAMKRQDRGFALSGTLGDGHYEGDVMVEVGMEVDITFADLWLNRAGLQTFFDRVDRNMVESALADAARIVVEGETENNQDCSCDSAPHVAMDRRASRTPIVSSGEALWPSSV
ncbi:MAG: hypothetical protein R6V08_11500 [Desulfuromonadales bacterium]